MSVSSAKRLESQMRTRCVATERHPLRALHRAIGVLLLTFVLGVLPREAAATSLDLIIRAYDKDGPSNITVVANCPVTYVVTGRLSDIFTRGLAGFGFDLVFDGGPLEPGEVPTESPMTAFAIPLGINNGWFGAAEATAFGGTPVRSRLKQCGGVMNTLGDGIETVSLPFPTGAPILSVGEDNPVVLLRGTVTSPALPRVYTLAISATCINEAEPSLSSDDLCESDSDCSGGEVCRGHPFASVMDPDQNHGGSHKAVSAAPVVNSPSPLARRLIITVVEEGTCSAMPPLPAPYPHDRAKSRYISFDTNKAGNDGLNIAFKIELQQITLGSCDGNGGPCSATSGCKTCSVDGDPCTLAWVDCASDPPQSCDPTGATCVNDEPFPGGTNLGLERWVAEPRDPSCFDIAEDVERTGYCLSSGHGTLCVDDADCPSICRMTFNPCDVDADCAQGLPCYHDQPCVEVPQCLGEDYVSRAVTVPFGSDNWPSIVHVTDCEIVPSAVYGVRAVNLDTGAESEELLVETGVWADSVSSLLKYCSGEDQRGLCNGNGDRCFVDSECPSGQACVVRMCADAYEPCQTAGDCAMAPVCIRGMCGDPSDICQEEVGDCPAGFDCIHTNSCYDDDDCWGSETCDSAWGPPDGAANFADVQAMVLSFAGTAESTIPHTSWVDLHGQTEITDTGGVIFRPPNYICNFTDIQLTVFAFQGRPYWFEDPANCGESLLGPVSAPVGSPLFTLQASDDLLDPGEDVQVDVFISEAVNVFAFEVNLGVTGGWGGVLTLSDITVDETRTDYLFFAESTILAVDMAGGRTGGSLSAVGPGVTKSGPVYLATFTFQPTPDATGAFRITLRDGAYSFLLDPDGTKQLTLTGDEAIVWAGVECVTDSDCQASSPCMIDYSCVSNACEYTYQPAGTACDDGLWCTRADTTCDGNGNCAGGTPRCPPGYICDEGMHLCFGEAP